MNIIINGTYSICQFLGSDNIRIDAIENHHKIINTAKELFKQKNVEDIGMTEIAKKAHIGIGTLYRNYKSKSEICMEVVLDNIRAFVNKNNRYLNQNTLPPNDAFYQILFSYLTFKDKNIKILNQIESSIRLGMKFYRSELYEKLNQLFQRIIKLKNPNYDEDTLRFNADMMITMLRSKEYIFQLKDRGLSKDMFIRRLMKII